MPRCSAKLRCAGGAGFLVPVSARATRQPRGATISMLEACSFLLLDGPPAVAAVACQDEGESEILKRKVAAKETRDLQLEVLQLAASALPGMLAAHSGLLAAGPMVAPCCMPLPVFFSVPVVHPDTWLANKRARAFHRATVVCVYTQGVLALLRFARGDLIGGLYDAVMAGIGMYATDPEGIRLIPSYVMMCGFNGVLGLLQIIQQMHGVPIFALPLTLVLPPIVALCGAYCGWQFAVELNAIGGGGADSGRPQDSCFVRFMGADWWPSSVTAPRREEEGPTSGSAARNFNPFAGDGHRLGQT